MARSTGENQKFSLRMQKKLVVLFLLVLLAFVGLSFRLFAITRDNGERYKKQVLSQQEYDSKVLPARRGDILDRNEMKLASSEKVYNVILDSYLVNQKPEEYIEPTVAALTACFGLDGGEIRSFLAGNPSSRYKILAKQVPYDDMAKFTQMETDAEHYPGIKGVWFEDSYIRKYPYGSLACDAIGFTSGDDIGMYGLEEYYNDMLRGTNGREYGYLNDDANLERTLKPAVDGKTLVTAIDTNIQSIVEKHILAFNKEHENEYREGRGSTNTGVVIMDPRNGEVLAMASYPVYDLSDPRKLDGLYTQEELSAMSDEEQLDALYDLWRNFCVFHAYEPGSTMKPFTVAAGLESGKLSGNESYECGGLLEVGGWKIKCNNHLGHGIQSVGDALANSCNVAMMHVGAQIGQQTYMKYMREFGFGLKTGIDLAGEPNTSTLIFDEQKMTPTDLAIGAFGQGFNVTMIEQITAFCSLINGGNYYQPHLVREIKNSDGVTLETVEPRLLKQTVSAETSKRMVEYMDNVVANGTGKNARPAGYTMGGKTGTAETYPRKTEHYVVSFIGYAPAVDPQVAIYTVIDEPNVAMQAQAKYAVSLTKNIMTEVLPYMNFVMTEEISEDEQKELDEFRATFSVSASGVGEETEEGEAQEGQEGAAGEQAAQSAEGGNGENGEKKPEESAEGDQAGPDGSSEGAAGEEAGTQDGEDSGEQKKDVQIDPETGYAIDPETGEFLDPQTGEPVEPSSNIDGLGAPPIQQIDDEGQELP